MPTKRSKINRLEIVAPGSREVRVPAAQPAFGVISGNAKLRNVMPTKSAASANEYLCAIERNQNGKYNVRVRAVFAPATRDSGNGRESNGHRSGWMLPVYFLASSFNAAMKKLEESLQLLQKNEARLRFWGVERTDDPNLTGDLLKEFGLGLDRRREFPRKAAELGVPRERPVPASMLAPVRRVLADSVAQERPVDRTATTIAGD
ncbi:MAG TPA: hypothetical protein VK757_05125 [Candidatus Acidoferrum sp.]|jgi:hypothetical protein|nr:hypothetical protein [Candidatus Acidoferrum sp.]